MERIGEVLLEAGLLSEDQCALGLRAQILFGGRLGTNLIELGYIDIDTLSRALGTQHGVPAALGRHFEDVDAELQQRVSPDTARRLECVPLNHVFGYKHGVVIASAAPLDAGQLDEIGDELLVPRAQLIQSIAAEMRIKLALEQVYKIRRPARFSRVKGSIPPYALRTAAILPPLRAPDSADAGDIDSGLTAALLADDREDKNA